MNDLTVQRRIDKLSPGDILRLRLDTSNEVNSAAVFVCDETDNPLGWVPDLLLDYIHDVLREGQYRVTVENANGEGVPHHFRLLARLSGQLPPAYELFAGAQWQALARVP